MQQVIQTAQKIFGNTASTSQNLFKRITNIEPTDHPALQVKGRDMLIGSEEKYMPEKIKGYDGSWPPAYKYTEKKADSKQFIDDLHAFAEEQLHQQGCVIIKGAPIQGQQDFSKMMDISKFVTTKYQGGTTFRDEKQQKVYTPTSENPGITMESHWDQPYWKNPPRKLMFYYENPAVDGVNNMINGREFLQKLDKNIVKKFEEKQIMYQHYYFGEGDSNRFVSWQRSMGHNKKEVEEYLKKDGYEFEWVNKGKDLIKWEISPAIKPHPKTGEKLWQNNISGHHGSYFHNHFLFPELKNIEFTNPDKFKGLNFNYYPHHTKYGDGTDIDYEIIKYLREQLWKNCVGVMAEAGDLVLVDNFVAGHGRLGYTPPRKAYISIITN